MRESELFFTQVKTLYAKEGKICLYDSAMVRAPAPVRNLPCRLCAQRSFVEKGGREEGCLKALSGVCSKCRT